MAKANNFGDIQLESDVACDKVIFAELAASKYVAHAHSEENIEVEGQYHILLLKLWFFNF